MRTARTLLTVLAFIVASASLSAQVDVTTGPQSLVANGGSFQWSVVVNFGPNAHTEDLNFSVTTTGDGFIVEMVDCTATARATNLTEWLDAQPEWDGTGQLAGTYSLNIGGAPYTSLSMSGVHRFFFNVRNPSTSSNTITFELDNGAATSATLAEPTSFPSPSYNPQSGTPTAITGTSSMAFVRHDVQQVYGIVNLGAASDELKFDIPVTFPTGGEALDISLVGILGLVATDVEFDVHLLADDGGSTPSASVAVAGSAANATAGIVQHTTGIYSGNQKFRVVVKGGTNFGGSILVNFYLTFSHRVTIGGAPTGEPAKANEPPVSITPASTTVPTSPQTLTGGGGSQNPVAFKWTIEGTVPPGVSLTNTPPSPNTLTTDIVFTAATPVGSTVTVRCTSPLDEWAEETYTLGANVLQISGPNDLPDGIVNAVYIGETIQAEYGQTPYSWDDNGTLPAGLSINAATGEITGSPNTGTDGTHSVTITVTDAAMDTADKTYNLEIVAAGSMTITTASLPSGTEEKGYGPVPIEVSPASPSYTFSATGLPSGLSINTSTGAISGTLAAGTAGDHNVTVSVSDSASTVNAVYTLTVELAPIDAGGGGGGGGCAVSGQSPLWPVIALILGLGVLVVLRRRRVDPAPARSVDR